MRPCPEIVDRDGASAMYNKVSKKVLATDAMTDLQMSCRRGDEGQDVEANCKGGINIVEIFKRYNIPISSPIDCTIRRIIHGTNGGHRLTQVDCQA